MRSGRRRRASSTGTDDHDEVALSGWLFADLILGLFVVFIGAVSIRYLPPPPEPEVVTDISGAEDETGGLECRTAMSETWVRIELPRNTPAPELLRLAEERIARALLDRPEIAPDAIFPFVMFFGRPEPGTSAASGPTQGRQFASEMRTVVLAGLPNRFPTSGFRDFYTASGDSRSVMVDLFPEVTVCQ
jgi:hypothetical protein